MPGVNVNITSVPVPTSNPTSTGKWFCTQLLERGSTTKPIVCTSMAEFKAQCGARVSYSVMWDSAETFFQEGGSELIMARVVGATPVAAKYELKDSEAHVSLIVTANSVGEWGNNLSVAVTVTESGYILTIEENDVEVEKSPELTTQLGAVAWAENSAYVTIAVGAGTKTPSEVTAKALSGGTYDSSHITTASYEHALANFSYEMGCGQVSAPGITTTGVGEAILKHVEVNNRVAMLDLTNTSTAATLISAVSSLRSAVGARRGSAWAPWAIIPGLAGGANRVVPYSAVQAGIIARNDGATTQPQVNEPSAAENGQPRYAIGLTAEWNRATREELNEHSVNVARVMPSGVIQTYGYRTLVKPESEPAWEEFSAARLFMYVVNQCEAIMSEFLFKDIDPKKQLFNRLNGRLTAFMTSLGNQLYNNPGEAVNTGPAVNTPTTIAKKEVCADVAVLPSPTSEIAVLNVSAQGV